VGINETTWLTSHGRKSGLNADDAPILGQEEVQAGGRVTSYDHHNDHLRDPLGP
jgi:hypothetical protein